MTDDPDDDGRVIAEIRPGPGTAVPPLFKILPRVPRGDKREGCQHSAFELDEKWLKVRCGKCDEVLDPFAVLVRYSEWWDKFDERRLLAERAMREMHIESLRRYRRLRGTTEEEQEAITDVIDRRWSVELAEVQELDWKINDARRERGLRR